MCLVLTCIFAVSVFAGSGDQPTPASDEGLQNQRGMKYFKEGYYEHMPRGRKAEARQNLDQAEKAFQKAIEINDNYADAHRNLARLYYLQEKFDQAATEYAQVIRLDPEDIDTHVHMALVQTELGNYGEAIRYLEKAKTKTTDERILQQLDGYIEKINQVE